MVITVSLYRTLEGLRCLSSLFSFVKRRIAFIKLKCMNILTSQRGDKENPQEDLQCNLLAFLQRYRIQTTDLTDTIRASTYHKAP